MNATNKGQFESIVCRVVIGTAVCVTLVGAASVAAQDFKYTMIDLGSLGGNRTTPTAMNDAGMVVGSAEIAAPVDEVHAFLWQNAQMTDLGTLGGGWAEAADINNAGQIVGSSWTDDGESHGFYWYDGAMIDLNDVGLQRPVIIDGGIVDIDGKRGDYCYMPDPTFTAATAISENGIIIATGTVFEWLQPRGYVLIPAKRFDPANPSFVLYELGFLPRADDCTPLGVNDTGVVVGRSGSKAFVWEDFEMGDLNLLAQVPALNSGANDVNNTGLIVGWTDQGIAHQPKPVVWTEGMRIDLGLPNGWVGEAGEVNDLGQIVGRAVAPASGRNQAREYAMYWDGTCLPMVLEEVTVFPLGPMPWNGLTEATDIDENGRIVGYGQYANGQTAAFMLVPIDGGVDDDR